MSEYDLENVEEVLRNPRADWFGAMLLRLIAKADNYNKEKIRKGFPEYVEAYERWYYRGGGL